MEEPFSKEIKEIKEELTQLKTAKQTSAGAITTVAHSINVPISLSLSNPDLASGYAVVRVSTTSDEMIMATLDSYYGDITQFTNFPATTRSVLILTEYRQSGVVIIELIATGNASDRSTLSGGGSVTITKQLTVRSTGEFTMEIV